MRVTVLGGRGPALHAYVAVAETCLVEGWRSAVEVERVGVARWQHLRQDAVGDCND